MMILKDVLREATIENMSKGNVENIVITGITDNSRDVKKGFLLVAVKGYSVDDHKCLTPGMK
jgi:UDP-N-acetylmuramoyl-L-alanyl-D-glutamate--2,6-diaminopimelate ligase